MQRLKVEGKIQQKKVKREAAKAVQERVSSHYQKANITTIFSNKMCEKIEEFHGEYQRTEWLPKKQKNSFLRNKFAKKLEETFPF